MTIDSVSILIPTHNRADLLQQTLQSLYDLRIPPNLEVELVVVANACTDKTEQVVSQARARLPMPCKLVHEPTPGASVARNRGMKECTGTICALLDDDVWVYPNWLEALLEVFRDYPADMVGGKVTLWWHDVQPPDWWSPALDGYLSCKDHGSMIQQLYHAADAISGNLAFYRKWFDLAGEFNPGLGRSGKNLLAGEEQDYIARALAKGCKLYFTPHAVVKHWVAPHRVCSSYLCRVAWGNAESAIYMKPPYTLPRFLRSLLGHTYLFVFHGLAQGLTYLTGHRSRRMVHRTLCYAGMGGLYGLWRRMTGRSPTKAA